MELVTVICERDEQDILLQAHSIDKFIEEPCSHWIKVEDGSKSILEWKDLLDPYYKRHRLNLVFTERPDGPHFPDPYGLGYRRQMTEKLKLAARVESDNSLLLDAKNIFVRPTKLSEWPYKNGRGVYTYLENEPADWFPKKWIYYIHEKTGLEIPKRFPPHMATPFALTTKYVKKAVEHPLFESLYFNTDVIPMTETFYYYFFVPDTELDPHGRTIYGSMNHLRLTRSVEHYVSDCLYLCDEQDSPTQGAHRRLRALMPQHTKDEYRDWLIGRGLDSKLVNDYVYFVHTDLAIGQ